METVKGIAQQVINNSGKVGTVLGVLFGSEGQYNDVIESIMNAVGGNIHLPNMIAILKDVPTQPGVYDALVAALFGWAIGEANVPIVGKYGTALSRAAVGYIGGVIGNRALYHSTHSKSLYRITDRSRSFDRSLYVDSDPGAYFADKGIGSYGVIQ